MKRTLTASEAAKFLGVSIPTIYNYLKDMALRQRLGAYKLTGAWGTRHPWRFRLERLQLFLQGNGQGQEHDRDETHA